MRTTIRLDEKLLQAAKKLAAETNQTLTAVIEGALREVLLRRQRPEPAQRVKLPSAGDGGLHPGVYLDDNAALRDLMDRPDDAS